VTPEKVAVARQVYAFQTFTVEQIAAALGVTAYVHLDRTTA
jgi:hypothetical protein